MATSGMRFQIMQRKGKECIHNLGYWSGIPYLGFGLVLLLILKGLVFLMRRI